jgi:hypothetical protein
MLRTDLKEFALSSGARDNIMDAPLFINPFDMPVFDAKVFAA